jgi:glutamine amidotransferase
MCRWLAYAGTPLFIEDLVTRPVHSLVRQSKLAKESEVLTHGDGFGIGWYGERDVPGVYRDVQPAWNDSNLLNLAFQIRSPLFMAHVRASTGSAVQRTNCHPFRHGRWLFQHNGEIYGHETIRRELICTVDPSLFTQIRGSTDSEVLFFLALTFGLEDDPLRGLERMAHFVEKVAGEKGITPALQMTVAVADGKRLYAVRYSSHGQSRSLFRSRDMDALRELSPAIHELQGEAVAIVSEPLTALTDHWKVIPEGTAVVAWDHTTEERPFTPRP